MKKFLIIGLIVALVLIFVGGAGVVYARVAGVEKGAVLTVTTDQNGNTITRQQFYGENGVVTYGEGNLLCQDGPKGDCNFSDGPGGMMQGYGPGGMMGGQQRGNRQGGMMGGYGPGGMMGGRAWQRLRSRDDGWSRQGHHDDYMMSAFAAQ